MDENKVVPDREFSITVSPTAPDVDPAEIERLAVAQVDLRPVVKLSTREDEVAANVIGNLASDSSLFQRLSRLVVAVPSDCGAKEIRPLPEAIIRGKICATSHLLRFDQRRGEWVDAHPTEWLVKSVAQHCYYPESIRHLVGICCTPTIRPDGSVLQTPGYDPVLRVLYEPNAQFAPVPDLPTKEDGRAAADKLFELLCDFPLVSDADKTCWLAFVLTLLLRSAFSGCCPLFAVTGNCPGAGKGLLLDLASTIAYGSPTQKTPYTEHDSETKKLITSIAIEGAPLAIFDNVDVPLGGAAIEAAITATEWSDRVLSKSQTTGKLPMRTTWAASGNQIQYRGDFARRVFPIRLQTEEENPELKTNFRYPNIQLHVAEKRPEFVIAALTIAKSYIAAGRPSVCKPVGSFEDWSNLVRSSIVWLGLADPADTRVSATENDTAKQLLRMLITGIQEADPDGVGLTTAEIENLTTYRPDPDRACPTLHAAIKQICPQAFNARIVGRKISSYVGRNCGGLCIRSAPAGGGVLRYSVAPVSGSKSGLSGLVIHSSVEKEMNDSGFTHTCLPPTPEILPTNPLVPLHNDEAST